MDIAGLKKFQETFGPVLAAIPAVLDAAAQMDDMNRALAIRRAEFEKATAEVQKVYDDADERLKAVNEILASSHADVIAAKVEAKDIRAKAKQAAEAVAAKAEDAVAGVDAALISKRAELTSLEQAYALMKFDAEAVHAAVMADLDVKTRDAEKRLATAEKALDLLKSRLG